MIITWVVVAMTTVMPGEVTGRVLDGDLELPGMCVRLETPTKVFETVTDEHGAFHFRGVSVGGAGLFVELAGLGSFHHAVCVQPRNTWKVVVPKRSSCPDTVTAEIPGHTPTLEDRAYSGFVVDGEGKPLRGALIEALSHDGGMTHTLTDSSGAFLIDPEDSSSTFRFSAEEFEVQVLVPSGCDRNLGTVTLFHACP